MRRTPRASGRVRASDQRQLDEVVARCADDRDQQATAGAGGASRTDRRTEPDYDAVAKPVDAIVFAERHVDESAEPPELVRHRIYANIHQQALSPRTWRNDIRSFNNQLYRDKAIPTTTVKFSDRQPDFLFTFSSNHGLYVS